MTQPVSRVTTCTSMARFPQIENGVRACLVRVLPPHDNEGP